MGEAAGSYLDHRVSEDGVEIAVGAELESMAHGAPVVGKVLGVDNLLLLWVNDEEDRALGEAVDEAVRGDFDAHDVAVARRRSRAEDHLFCFPVHDVNLGFDGGAVAAAARIC